MVDDHTKVQNDLKPVAEQAHVTLPATMNRTDEALKARLSKLSGITFDRAYMSAMLRDHRADVTEFRTESTSAKDPGVKAFAAKTLPTLEDHLKLAETTDRDVAPAATTGKIGAATTTGR